MRYLLLIVSLLCNGPSAFGSQPGNDCAKALARAEAVKAELAALMRRKANEDSLALRSILANNIETKRKEYREATGMDPDPEEMARLLLLSASQQATPEEERKRREVEGGLGFQLHLEKKGLFPSNIKNQPQFQLIKGSKSTKILYINQGEWRLKDLETNQDVFLGSWLMDLAYYRSNAADLIVRGLAYKHGERNIIEILDAETGRFVETPVSIYSLAPELETLGVTGRCKFFPYTNPNGKMRVLFACHTPGNEWSIYDYAPELASARKITTVNGTLGFYTSGDGRNVYGWNLSIEKKSELDLTVYELTSGRKLAEETFKFDYSWIPQIDDISVSQTRTGEPYLGMNLPGADQIVIRNLKTGATSHYSRRKNSLLPRGGYFSEDSAGRLYYVRGWDQKENAAGRTFPVIDVKKGTETDLGELEHMGFGGFSAGAFEFDSLGVMAILDDVQLTNPARHILALIPLAGGPPVLLEKHSSDAGRLVGVFRTSDQSVFGLFKNRWEEGAEELNLNVFQIYKPAK